VRDGLAGAQLEMLFTAEIAENAEIRKNRRQFFLGALGGLGGKTRFG
jgi:hypothetical protein